MKKRAHKSAMKAAITIEIDNKIISLLVSETDRVAIITDGGKPMILDSRDEIVYPAIELMKRVAHRPANAVTPYPQTAAAGLTDDMGEPA